MTQAILYLLLLLLPGKSDLNTYTRLSDYEFFTNLADLEPADRVYPYDLNTPLFTDYAWKERFIYIPEGKKMTYTDSTVFDFPDGTVLIKNFHYPDDFRKPEKGRRIIETRLLIKEESGWTALPYIWNDEQDDAILSIAGGIRKVSWRHYNGKKRDVNYLIPNVNQCKGCHSVDNQMEPIGPAARHLNKEGTGKFAGKNQLQAFIEAGIIDTLPEETIPKNAIWNDPSTGSLDERARAWLEINCAHCHDEKGPASNTGLYLSVYEKSQTRLGVFKPPVAAGRGSESLEYDIVPGNPEESILLARMITDDVGTRMPEIGRSTMDEEAVALIREWIKNMN